MDQNSATKRLAPPACRPERHQRGLRDQAKAKNITPVHVFTLTSQVAVLSAHSRYKSFRPADKERKRQNDREKKPRISPACGVSGEVNQVESHTSRYWFLLNQQSADVESDVDLLEPKANPAQTNTLTRQRAQ
ncbi:hypothetical protein RRG08_031176 [Elysia crispata]|uniref:Uncharacterized protein n=1 Tax=Elysia crispata TaxID=231223 RepID=A0AAE1DG99_9GAST|nr:hypothetical protein RRG08_031176 [Elysia crispata]